MNSYFFDKAKAEDRAERIRAESRKQQFEAQFKQHNVVDSETQEKAVVVIRPVFNRAIGLSIIIIFISLLLLVSVSSVAEAQVFEPGSSGGSSNGSSEAMLTFTLGNIAYVRGNYEKAHTLFAEAIALIPQEIFERDPNYAHMYAYLGKAQLALGMRAQAMKSYEAYFGYVGEYADPRVVQFVATTRF